MAEKGRVDESDLALEEALCRIGLDDEPESESGSSDEDSSNETGQSRNDAGKMDLPGKKDSIACNGQPASAHFPAKRPAGGFCRHSPAPSDISEPAPHHQLPSMASNHVEGREACLTLRNIFEDDRVFVVFRRFLKDQCMTRNLAFWLACEHYRQMAPDDAELLRKTALAVYHKFIKSTAPQRIQIREVSKRHVKTILELRSRGPISPRLFQDAQREVWEIMERSEMRQFLVSDSFDDCRPFLPNVIVSLASIPFNYNPGMSFGPYGGRAGGSMQQSGSEDSASITSFNTDSDAGGARSAVFLKKHFHPAHRGTVSDTEATSSSKRQLMGPHITKDKPVSHKDFFALVYDRLAAVMKDHEAMKRRVQDMGREEGRTYEDIMALEWYDLPEACRHGNYESAPASGALCMVVPPSSLVRPRHTLSPSPHSQGETPNSSRKMTHINSLAIREVEEALRDYQITSQVNRKHRTRVTAGSGCSSVPSTTSDSGVGDGWSTAGGFITDLVTPPPDERLHSYLATQKNLTSSMPERERKAQAAAMIFISNSPQPEQLNPAPMPQTGNPRERHPHGRRGASHGSFGHANYPGAYSSDDSSSCFTMTSQSSTSDLFIPKRNHHPAYSDSDETRNFGASRYHKRNIWSPPKRSQGHMHKQPPGPSPIAEQRLTNPVQARSGDILVVYHLDDFPTPYAKRVSSVPLTLADFKDKVFSRKGEYRFFFKSYCEDLNMDIMEEYADDRGVLPLYQGKIMGRVERIA